MRILKLFAMTIVLILTVGMMMVSAEQATTTTQNSIRDLIPTETAGDIPQTVKNLLKQQVYIAPTERLKPLEISSIREACDKLMDQSFDLRVEIPTETKAGFEVFNNVDEAELTESYIYTLTETENGITTEFVYSFDGTVIKTVGYELNGVRYVAFNDDNRVMMMEGAPSAQATGREATAINISDVLFGFVIAVVLVMIVAAVVIAKKKANNK